MENKNSNRKYKKKANMISIFWIIFFILILAIVFWLMYSFHNSRKEKEITKIDSSIPIPEGFYFVGGTKNTGFVISDNKSDYKKGTSHEASKKLKGNQFVWVPVEDPVADSEGSLKEMISENKYPMALKTNDGYKGVLYTFNNFEKMYYPMLDVNEIGEPKILTDPVYGDLEEMLEGSTGNLYQESFNKMIKSVEKNKGFYISRYEAGNLSSAIEGNGSVVSKSGQTDISNTSWFYMYKSIKKMYERDDITTEIIWGSQWDAVLRWICSNNDNFYDLRYDNGNFSNEKKATGLEESYAINNIYDMYGNVSEWTQTGARDASRVARGSDYSSKKSIANMEYFGVTYLYEKLGTRITLYIN